MKVILLTGNPHSGKTTTMNLVYDELMSLGATIVRPKTQLGGDPKDFDCVLSYKGQQVALFSVGDSSIEVIHAMSYYEGVGCDVLVVPNSNKSWPIWRLQRYPNHVQLSKTMPLSNASNDHDKNLIVSHI